MKSRYSKTILLLIFAPIVLMADRSDQYQRKSVSYINTLFFTDPAIEIPSRYRNHLVSKIHEATRLERFDYNILPEKVLKNFRKESAEKGRLSISELEDLLQETLGKELVKILDVNKEIRAAGLITEVQRNQFIATKAKELGITGEQLMLIMNSAYVYLPVITDYSIKKEDKEIKCHLTGGIIWFRFEVGGDTTRFVKYKQMLVDANSSVDKDKGKWSAFKDAVFILATDLNVRVRSLEDFRLSTTIKKIKGKNVYFPLGKREGLKTDDPFYVGEWYQDKSGQVSFHTDGFVRVGQIADNTQDRDALSSAWAIKRGYWVKGMTLKEHPRLPVDLCIRPKYFPLILESGTLFRDNFISLNFDDYTSGAFGISLDLQLNLAPFTGKSQTFIIAGGSYGLTGIDFEAEEHITGNEWTIADFGVMSFMDGHVGYMKKYYFRRLAFRPLITLGFQQILVSEEIDDKTLSLIHRSFGATFDMGLEFALNIDTNIGLEVGYRMYPTGYWLMKYDDKEKDFEIPVDIFNPEKPDVYSDGLEFSLYIHYSLPSLSFFPFSEFKPSKIGKFIWGNL